MNTINKLYCLLALLIMGSASIQAQDQDPFPEVNLAQHENTMNLTAQVRMGGKVLGKETIVAVYQGDEIRGKARPSNGKKFVLRRK